MSAARTCRTCRWFASCADQSGSICTAYITAVQPIAVRVDHKTTDRIAKWAREHLASLSPERRAELDREFGN
jgi:hypothetical protein